MKLMPKQQQNPCSQPIYVVLTVMVWQGLAATYVCGKQIVLTQNPI